MFYVRSFDVKQTIIAVFYISIKKNYFKQFVAPWSYEQIERRNFN